MTSHYPFTKINSLYSVSYTFLNKSTKIFIPKRFTGGKKAVEAIGKAMAENQSTTTRATANAMNSKNLSTNNSFKDPGEISKNTPSEKSLTETAKEDLVKPSFLKGTPKSLREQVEEAHLSPEGSNLARHKTQKVFEQQKTVITSEEYPSVDQELIIQKPHSNLNSDDPYSSTVYKGVYIDKPYHVQDSSAQIGNELQDSEHVFVAIDEPFDSLGIIGRATSAKGGTPMGKITNVRISSTKYDGSYTEQRRNEARGIGDFGEGEKSSKIKKGPPIVDDYGNTLPDPLKGGQYFQPYANKRVITAEEKALLGVTENPEATAYFNQPEVQAQLDAIVAANTANDASVVLSCESMTNLTQTKDYDNTNAFDAADETEI